MRSAPAVLALLLLLAGPAVARPECAEAVLRVQLSPEPWATPEVCLSPGQETAFRTSTRLLPNGVRVEPAARPLEWAIFPQGVVFFTSDELAPGERFTLRLLLAGPQEPMAVAFTLVVHPARATRQVQLSFGERPAADYPREAREATARAERREAERARLEAACTGPTGLLGLLGAPPIVASNFVAAKLTDHVKESSRQPLGLQELTAYRVELQVALAVELHNPTAQPWTTARAQLADARGRKVALLPLPPMAPIEPGSVWGTVLVGATLPLGAPMGPYTLTLWDESGRTVTLGNINFP